MYHNEKMYEDALEVHAKQDESMIFIPPASWKDMLSSLSKVEYVQLKQNEQLFQGLQVSKGLLRYTLNLQREIMADYTSYRWSKSCTSYGYV